jgi:transposase-like protein
MFQELPGEYQHELLEELLLEQELKGMVLQQARESLKVKRKKKPCPHCSSSKVHKRGKQRGIQMYRCNSCNKWYSKTMGTPLYDIKLKNKWQSYINCM